MVTFRFDLSGGRLCLDLANTVSNRGTGTPVDHLQDYEDFLAFSDQAAAASAASVRELRRRAEAHPAEARRALARAVSVREALFRIFDAAASGRRPRPDDLSALDAEIPWAFAHAHLEKEGGRFTLAAAPSADDLASPLVAVVKSAVDLLTSPDLERVRTCAADTCQWLFIDTTKNRTRRWCDMKVCGNREKARRFRARA